MKHVVLGKGSAPEKVIIEGLKDILKDGDEIAFAWSGSPVPEGIEAVYGYVLDNEIPFVMVYTEDQKVPGSFRMAEHGVVQKVRNPIQSLLKDLDGKVLVLWSDDENDEGGLIDQIFDAAPDASVLELTNGLAPIVIEADAPAEAPSAPAEQDDEDSSYFTEEQLRSMAPPAVVRYGKNRGCSATTKDGVIAELFGSPAPVSSLSDESFETEMTILISNFFHIGQPGFETDMAHLALGQARLWMLKSLARVTD
jgi:hypothetical protein